MIFFLLLMFEPTKSGLSTGWGGMYLNEKGISITGSRLYGINETLSFLFNYNGRFNLAFSSFGIEDYREETMGVGIPVNFDYAILLIKGNLHYLREENDIRWGASSDMFLFWHYTNFSGGLNLISPLSYFSGDTVYGEEQIFFLMKSRNIRTGIKLSFIRGWGIEAGGGIEISFGSLEVRSGFRTNPVVPTMGFSFVKSPFRFDFGFESHPVLGISESVTLRIGE